MPNTITTQTILDGHRNLVVKTYIVSDGTALSDTVLINVSDFLDSVGATLTRVTILKVEAAFVGAWSAQLFWDATTNVPIVTIPGDVTDFVRDYTSIGGLPNNAGTGITGDILWSSLALANTDEGHITLYMAKK